MLVLSLIQTALAERTDTVSWAGASLTMNDQWAAQFYTATQDATLTRVAVSGYESMAGAATVDVYLWTRAAGGGYTATSLGTLSFVGASWSTYTLNLATPRSLVAGQTYGVGFVSNDVAWIPWESSSSYPVDDTVWGTGLGFGYGAASTSGSRDLASSTRLYAYGGPSFSMTVALADLDADGFDVLDDCDDTDADVYPGAPEVWYDGIDQGCDGRVADDDADGDGHDADFAGGDDCDDTSRVIHPGAVDVWYDGVDGDCAGDDDHDQDGDGYAAPSGGGTDCDDLSASVRPGAVDAWYDGVDADCVGNDDYDQDRDGYRARTWGGDDCDDVSASVHPGASDRDYDGIDSDCAGDSDTTVMATATSRPSTAVMTATTTTPRAGTTAPRRTPAVATPARRTREPPIPAAATRVAPTPVRPIPAAGTPVRPIPGRRTGAPWTRATPTREPRTRARTRTPASVRAPVRHARRLARRAVAPPLLGAGRVPWC